MYCILISGIPAAGKSTIARRISERLNLPVLSKDDIKEILFDQIGFESRAEKVKLGTAGMEIMYYAAAQLMKSGIPFILENNFENASKEGLARLLRQYDYSALTVTLTGDYEAIYHRFLERNISPDRHRGHVVNDCYPEKQPHTDAELLASTISLQQFIDGIRARGFDTFIGDKDRIIVDTTDFSNVNFEELLIRIDQWCKAHMPQPNLI